MNMVEIDQLLSILNVPFFLGMPEFDGNSPEKFVVYMDYEVPGLAADNRLLSVITNLTLSIFFNSKNELLISKTKKLLLDNGYVYKGGQRFTDKDMAYPCKGRYDLEFEIDTEEE